MKRRIGLRKTLRSILRQIPETTNVVGQSNRLAAFLVSEKISLRRTVIRLAHLSAECGVLSFGRQKTEEIRLVCGILTQNSKLKTQNYFTDH